MKTLGLSRLSLRSAAAIYLAATLSVPLLHVAAGKVAAACYLTWTSSNTVSDSVSPATGLTYTGRVTYRIEYDTCHLDSPRRVNVQSFRYTMAISGGSTTVVHQDAARSVLEWFRNYPYDYKIVWNNTTIYRRTGNGTWTLSFSPNVYMWYSRDAAIRSYWTGCSQTGPGQCQIWYRFLRGDWTVRWTL
jgi:hypothetical protein